jgi:hypothetical protein
MRRSYWEFTRYAMALRNSTNVLPQKAEKPMQSIKMTKEFYTEAEAAQALGISIARLYQLLDEHLFNDGTQRPEGVTFRPSDLVLLGFWHKSTPNPKIVRMPNSRS